MAQRMDCSDVVVFNDDENQGQNVIRVASINLRKSQDTSGPQLMSYLHRQSVKGHSIDILCAQEFWQDQCTCTMTGIPEVYQVLLWK